MQINWEDLTKEELIFSVNKLSEQLSTKVVNQIYNETLKLRNIEHVENPKKKRKLKKSFDLSKFHERHIALKVFYDGSQYQGFAAQSHTDETIEGYVLKALEKTCLIKSRDTCNYSKCGRTDIGVSAHSQVLAFNLRSNLLKGVDFVDNNIGINVDDKEREELDYPKMINAVLPSDIRVYGWAAVGKEFSARFDTKRRVYRYYFIKRNLDLKLMKEASDLIIGIHDFRNFCKMDVEHVKTFVRTIYQIEIKKMFENANAEKEVYCLEIQGQAFLWHQVRCIMSILFLIGSRLEDIVTDLLDITKYPRKPLYKIAEQLPLHLYNCVYDNLNFTISKDCLISLRKWAEDRWENDIIKLLRTEQMVDKLIEIDPSLKLDLPCSYFEVRTRNYKKLCKRTCATSLEERLLKYADKNSLEEDSDE